MAELRFQGQETGPFPLYLNPNIWTVVDADPTTATRSPPRVNLTTWIWCSVTNTGSQSVTGVKVRFYVRDPSTVLTPGSGPPLGTSTVALLPNETKEVLCVTPWVPTWINNGHECVVCELSAPSDPGVFPPDAPWDLNDRHVAQRNFQLIAAEPSNRLSFSQVVVRGLANDAVARVSIRPAPEQIFKQSLRANGLDEFVTKNITDSCRFGLLANHRLQDKLPDNATKISDVQIKLGRNEQGAVTAVIQGPEDGWSKGFAGLFLIEQFDKKGSVVGGSAAMVAQIDKETSNAAVDGRDSAPELIQRIPASIPFRPYSARADFPLMNADGIFLANYGNQYIGVEPRNDGPDALTDLEMYIEGASDPNIPITSSVIRARRSVEPNASFKSQFLADFSNAVPGETILSFIIQNATANTFIRIIKKIFVTRVEYDKDNKDFYVPFPQGMLKMHLNVGILPRADGSEQCKCDKGGKNDVVVSPAFVKSATLTWTPNPPYAGVHGPLPFNDPWNKVAGAAIVALLALLAGALLLIDYLDRHSGNGGGGGGQVPETRVEVSVGGTFDTSDPSFNCCNKVKTSNSLNTGMEVVAGVLLAAAGWAAKITIASDEADFFFRGQEQTVPAETELTVSEVVKFEADYAEVPSLGVPYKGSVKWSYVRSVDSGRTLEYETESTYSNPHYLSKYTIQIDGSLDPNNHYIHDRRFKKPLTICSQFFDPNGNIIVGNQIYVTCLLWTSTGRVTFHKLRDDGIHDSFLDFNPNSGNYCIEIPTSLDDPAGDWYVFVFAQNVNTVLEGTDPYTAAKTIGGFVLTNQLTVSFDPNDSPCELTHDAVITVI